MAHVDAGKTTTTERILFYSGRDVAHRRGRRRARRSPTGWRRSRSAASRSPPPRPRSAGSGHVVNLIDTPGPRRLHDGGRALAARARRRDRRVLRGRGRRAAERDGVAPGRSLPRPAPRLHQQVRSRGRRARARDRRDARPGSARRRSRSSCRVGARARATLRRRRSISITMRARTWDAATFGATFTDGPIPHAHVADGEPRARADARGDRRARRRADGRVGRRAASCRPSAIRAALRRVTLAGRGVPDAASARRSATRASTTCSTRCSTTCRRRPTSREVRGRDPRGSDRRADAARARSAPTPTTSRSPRSRSRSRTTTHGGQLTFVRVYTGCLRVGDTVLNATKGHLEQIGRLVRMFANHREDIRQIEAGMIGARASASARPARDRRHAVRSARRRSCSIRSRSRTR